MKCDDNRILTSCNAKTTTVKIKLVFTSVYVFAEIFYTFMIAIVIRSFPLIQCVSLLQSIDFNKHLELFLHKHQSSFNDCLLFNCCMIKTKLQHPCLFPFLLTQCVKYFAL